MSIQRAQVIGFTITGRGPVGRVFIRARLELVIDAQHEDAGVSTGRIALDVTESTVQGDDQAAIRRRSRRHRWIVRTGQTLVLDRINIVAR